MRLLIKYIIRNINENLGRTILIMLSLFVVAIMISIITLISLFFTMINDAYKDAFSFEYAITSTTGEYISNKVLDKLGDDFSLLGLPSGIYGYIQDDKNEYHATALQGVDIEKATDFNLIKIKNEEKLELEKNETIITTDISKKYNLKKGDEFEYFGRNGEQHTLKVKYIIGSLMQLDNEIKIITNEETYSIINSNKDMEYRLLFGKYKTSGDDILEKIGNYETELGLDFNINENTNNILKEYIYPAIIAVILIFAVIFVSLNSIVKIIINERIADIGTFRSIGTSKKQVIMMLIIELLIYSVIPALIGGAIGVAMLKGFQGMFNYAFELLGSSAKIDMVKYLLPVSLITVVITITFQILLSIFELIKVSKMSIKDTIFNKHSSIYKYSIMKIIFGIFFLIIGIISIIKYKQLNYWYCLIGIISILVSTALIVPPISVILIKILEKCKNPIIMMAINKVKNSSHQINTNIIFVVTVSVSLVTYSFFNYMMLNEKTKENAINSDVYAEEIGENIKMIYDKTDDFYKLEGVNSVSTLYDTTISTNINYDKIQLANNDIKEIHLIYSNDYEKLLNDCNLLNIDINTAQSLKKYEVILSEYYKNIYELKVGDTFVLNWESDEENFEINTPINLVIKGFADLSKIQNNTIIVSSELGEELSTLLFDGYSNVKYFINLKDSSSNNAKEIRKSIIEQLGIYSNGMTGNVFTKDGYVKNVKNNSENYITFAVIIVIAIVGLSLIGIINNQTVSFMERKKELATLYSIAMSRKQLKNMILIENIISFINSSIASVIFYLMISKLVEYTLQILLIPISIKFTISGILIFALVMLLILFGIQKSMRKQIKKMNIVEEIKYE